MILDFYSVKSPLIIRLFADLDYHESVTLQKTSLKDLILIIKSMGKNNSKSSNGSSGHRRRRHEVWSDAKETKGPECT